MDSFGSLLVKRSSLGIILEKRGHFVLLSTDLWRISSEQKRSWVDCQMQILHGLIIMPICKLEMTETVLILGSIFLSKSTQDNELSSWESRVGR